MLLSSCGSPKGNDSITCTLHYYENEFRDSIAEKKVTFDNAPSTELVQRLFNLLSTPENDKSIPILTSDIKLTEARINDENCELILSSRYLELPEQKRAKLNACITKTICSIPDIERVVIICEDASISFTADDFVTETPRTHHNMFTANLYFANDKGDALSKESRTISLESEESLEYLVLSELIAGPSDINSRQLLSEKIIINSVQVVEGVCIIDLSSDFISETEHTELAEQLTVYSIVNTMTELPMINSVNFLINGNAGHGFEHIDISKPLTNQSEFPSV